MVSAGSALAQGEAQGLAQGEAQGLAQGLAQGEAQGLAQGEAQGLAQGEAQGLAQGGQEAQGPQAATAAPLLRAPGAAKSIVLVAIAPTLNAAAIPNKAMC